MTITKVGLIAGSFDIIHPGYIRMFRQAKMSCDHLIIALQTDSTIDRPQKCKPIQTWDERREILLGLRDVDEVIEYTDEKSLLVLLESTKHDIRILGDEYKDAEYKGKHLNKEVLWIVRDHNYSTTAIKEKIYQERKQWHDSN